MTDGSSLSAEACAPVAVTSQGQAAATDRDGHVLKARWEEYRSAVSKDKPRKQMQTLDGIREEALSRHLPWDWWDASAKYLDAAVSLNWKMSDSLCAALGAEVKAFDEPVVSVQYARTRTSKGEYQLLADIMSDASRLRQLSNKAFWDNDPAVSGELGGCLPQYIANDLEYALWSILPYSGKGNGLAEDRTWQALQSELSARYPAAGWAEYRSISAMSDAAARKAALEEYASKYSGKALRYYAVADLLGMQLDSLGRCGGTSSDYAALLARCEAFERGRLALRGGEREMTRGLTSVKGIIRELGSPAIAVSEVVSDTATVLLRNLRTARSQLRRAEGGDCLHTLDLTDTLGRFYVYDTVVVPLPRTDDGSYVLEVSSGDIRDSYAFDKYSISLAQRCDSRGHGIYLADSRSGRPFSSASFTLSKNGKEVASAVDVPLQEGFTPLPDKLESKIKGGGYYRLSASCPGDDGTLRRSRELGLSEGDLHVRSDAAYLSGECEVFTDRGAYNPGDTLMFKAILFERSSLAPVRTLQGQEVSAALYDSEGKRLSELSLTSGAFGSVAGSFAIPKGLRGGIFRLEVSSKDGKLAGTRSVRVDDFVPPSSFLTFDAIDRLLLPGDTLRFGGKVTSLSGRSMSSAVLSYKAKSYGSVLSEGTSRIASDGSFAIEVPTDPEREWQAVSLEVRLTDGTGETASYSTYAQVSKHLDIGVSVANAADAQTSLVPSPGQQEQGVWWRRHDAASVVTADTVRLGLTAGETRGEEMEWNLASEDGSTLADGKALSGSEIALAIPGEGLYKLKASLSVIHNGERLHWADSCNILRINPDATSIDAPVDYVILPASDESRDGDDIRIRLGSASGDLWAVAEVFGGSRELLDSKLLHLDGRRAGPGSLADILFEYGSGWPDAVTVNLFWFRRSSRVSWSREFHRRHVQTVALPLSFSSFTDKALPGQRCTVTIQTGPGAECLAAVFDKSIDKVASNSWQPVWRGVSGAPRVNVSSVCGGETPYMVSPRLMTKSLGAVALANAAVETASETDEAVMYDTAPALDAGTRNAPLQADDVAVREEFAATLAFRPFLHPDAGGEAVLEFETSGKLSTYHVQVYAHDKEMRDASVCRDITVTLPVQVSLSEPKYLYAGDKWQLAAQVSSNADVPVHGRMYLYRYDTGQWRDASPLYVEDRQVTVAAGGTEVCAFDVDAPASVPDTEAVIGLRLVFVSDDGHWSDGMFVSVPVYPDAQTLTEAHSAVLLPGMDRDSLAASLRSEFVNITDTESMQAKEVTILDMLEEAVPSKADPASDNVLDLSEAWYVRLVARKLGVEMSGQELSDSELVDKIFSCLNADGGYSWFEGMDSSPVITAVLLERFARLRDAGLLPDGFPSQDVSVAYLDNSQFAGSLRPLWRGGVSDEQYLHVRARYASVPFDPQPSGAGKSDFDKRMSEFRKYARSYLTPKGARGLNGRILAKARRLSTLSNLLSSKDGIALAKSWGVSLSAGGKLAKSMDADAASLMEYAVSGSSGGIYYPNAVAPWKGLLESEAYAHSLLCDLLDGYARMDGSPKEQAAGAHRIAEGIRIWLMLQKETQHWDSDPAFVDAISSVMDGSDDVKSVSVLTMNASRRKPFAQIVPSGNGMSVERKLYKERTVRREADGMHDPDSTDVSVWEEISPGTVLQVGDKIRAEYRIWSQDNRSHVRLTVPREASLTPVQQLSGYCGTRIRPLGAARLGISAGGYRDVRYDRSEFWFESWPEEGGTVSEEYFVTRGGTFCAPAVTVESMYAPHYRANSDSGTMTAQ